MTHKRKFWWILETRENSKTREVKYPSSEHLSQDYPFQEDKKEEVPVWHRRVYPEDKWPKQIVDLESRQQDSFKEIQCTSEQTRSMIQPRAILESVLLLETTLR